MSIDAPSLDASRIHARRTRCRPGFSLILSLTVMAMLLLLCIGAAALLSVQIRVARTSSERKVAEMNAMAALRLALAQLQENAGPDRRVTGALAILNRPSKDSPASPTDPRPGDRWTGVWRTDRLRADANLSPESRKPIVFRDVATAGLNDRRALPGYDANVELLEPLISFPDPARPPLASVALTEDAGNVRLLGAGSLPADAVAKSGVVVPKLILNAPGDAGEIGRCAWWTSDEASKARIDLRATAVSSVPPQVSEIFGLGSIAGLESLVRDRLPANDMRRALLDPARLPALGVPSDRVKRLRNSLTTGTLSVLADTAHGGLKRDLSAYLNSKGVIADSEDSPAFPGITDDDPLVESRFEIPPASATGKYAKSAPRFGILRDWATMRAVAGGGTRLKPQYMTQKFMSPVESQAAIANSQPVLQAPVKQTLEPVLVEAGFFLRLTYDPAADPTKTLAANTGLRMQIYPRFQLWNPYNVTLTGKEYLAHVRMLTPLTDGKSYFEVNGKRVAFNLPSWGTSLAMSGSTLGSLLFVLRTGDIAPGECAVYTPAGAARKYDAANPAMNVLTPSPGGAASYFYINPSDNIISGRKALSFAAGAINPCKPPDDSGLFDSDSG